MILTKRSFLILLGLSIGSIAMAQTLGSKVKLSAVDGKTYTGVITGVKGDKFQVKYDGIDFTASLLSSQFIVLPPAPAPAPDISTTPTKNVALTGNTPTKENLVVWMDKIIAKTASKGSDGAVTYEIMSFQLGSPRKWQYNDGGNPSKGHNTIVYPVRVRFIQKTHYRSRTQVIDRQCVFTSFIDAFDEWTFGYSSVPHIDKSYDEPSDM